MNWPFPDPRNVAVITVRDVFKAAPILLVCRDTDDGMWQFLTGGPFAMEDALIVALEEVTNLDPSLFGLADLEPGWQAQRQSRTGPWLRSRLPPDADDS